MTNEWITDRQPTKEDEDEDGEVLMQRFPDGRKSSGGRIDACVAAAHVGLGVPWKRTSIWRPSATPTPEPEAPTPAPKPELRVGQVWKRRTGGSMTVKSVDGDRFRVTDGQGFDWAYRPDGSGVSLSPGLDLIELISDAPAEPTTRKVPRLFAAPPVRTWAPDGEEVLTALADDGTCWWSPGGEWRQIRPLPDREEPADA